ncbi:hypothetical protein [Lacticaseibacillus zhaodongensis]|uniref:hypothetical protein n=1 Tax=Lacticaseibacillus zhaodongensis TaxID=2668065 RepID=UPI0012D31C41|nr:hypothetical protein [Lacticaseibacillus zhaodongensis]
MSIKSLRDKHLTAAIMQDNGGDDSYAWARQWTARKLQEFHAGKCFAARRNPIFDPTAEPSSRIMVRLSNRTQKKPEAGATATDFSI